MDLNGGDLKVLLGNGNPYVVRPDYPSTVRHFFSSMHWQALEKVNLFRKMPRQCPVQVVLVGNGRVVQTYVSKGIVPNCKSELNFVEINTCCKSL